MAPLAERTLAVARLRERKQMLSGWFEKTGGVDVFIDLLAAHLEAQPGKFVSVELEEIEAIHGDQDIPDVLRTALQRLDAREEASLDLLLPLSTVLEDRKFLPPHEAAKSGAREDTWNVYRLIGGGWLLPTPWDDADPQVDLRRTLNASRRRDAFSLRLPSG